MGQTAATQEAIEAVIATRPRVHLSDEDWGLDEDVLRWLAARVEPSWRTAETGCGLSSIVLGLAAGSHTIVAPAPHEHEAIRRWFRERDLSLEGLTSIEAHSQDGLPALSRGRLDLALIDGSHAFPVPMIDWYYLGQRLQPGSFMLIDDLHIRSCRLLAEFLESEQERWEADRSLGRTAIFRKRGDELIPQTDWVGQPWSAAAAEKQGLSERIRSAVRLRTRLHLKRSS